MRRHSRSHRSGYFFSHDADNAGLAPLLGQDVRDDSVSWMQGAGAIVSTPEDLTHWCRALYSGPILAPKQRAELFTLVSLRTGKPIATTTASEPRGFGLGVAQMTMPQLGTVWFYEGMTLGYRMIHIYFPKQDAVIAFGLNSQPDSNRTSRKSSASRSTRRSTLQDDCRCSISPTSPISGSSSCDSWRAPCTPRAVTTICGIREPRQEHRFAVGIHEVSRRRGDRGRTRRHRGRAAATRGDRAHPHHAGRDPKRRSSYGRPASGARRASAGPTTSRSSRCCWS